MLSVLCLNVVCALISSVMCFEYRLYFALILSLLYIYIYLKAVCVLVKFCLCHVWMSSVLWLNFVCVLLKCRLCCFWMSSLSIIRNTAWRPTCRVSAGPGGWCGWWGSLCSGHPSDPSHSGMRSWRDAQKYILNHVHLGPLTGKYSQRWQSTIFYVRFHSFPYLNFSPKPC